MHKKYGLLTAGSVGLIVAASASMAAAPGSGGFGQYSATGGTVTGCISGATCSTLVTGAGFLQQQVTVTSGVGAGETFYRTVILDSGATNTGSGFGNSTFADESFVNSAGNGDLADQNYVGFTSNSEAGSGQTSSTTLAGITLPNNSVESILARGNLAVGVATAANLLSGAADAQGIKIVQNNDFGVDESATGTTIAEPSAAAGVGGGLRQVNFTFISNDSAGSQTPGANFYMRIDEPSTGTDEGPFAVRESSGLFTAANNNGAGVGVLETPDGQTLNYSAGDDIKVSWMSTTALGGGTFGYPTTGTAVGNAGASNAVIEAETFTNKSTGNSIQWVNDTHPEVATNAGVIAGNIESGDNDANAGGPMTGYPQVWFTPQNTTSAAAQWQSAYWDPNFGSAPIGEYENASQTAAVQPGFSAFPQ